MSAVRPSVVVGVDGSSSDDVAIRWAAQEAAMRALPLRIVHVANPPTLPPVMSHDLADLVLARFGVATSEIVESATGRAQAVAPGIDVDHEVRPGQVVEQLVAAASGARLLVLGSGQRFDTSMVRLGSVATHVTAHAPCPVLVARIPQLGEPTGGPDAGRVVVGVDGSAASAAAVGFAFEEASRRSLGVTAVHAWQDEPDAWMVDVRDLGEYDRAAARVLAESLAGWTEKYPDVEVISRRIQRRAVQALIDASAGAVLLVVGSHGKGRFAGMLLGSVSQAVLRHASVPVAVVRGPVF
ncbi:MAG TPA: universal stress protein [Jiangellaceae bacterium]|nr:universal stress protein [Jiangellaceae bacterium]